VPFTVVNQKLVTVDDTAAVPATPPPPPTLRATPGCPA